MALPKLITLALLFSQTTAELLHPESALTHNCFNFPSSSFHRKNNIKATYGASPHAAGGLEVGDKAYDFTLSTLNDESVTLSTLISTKPVLLVWGMFTCPAFQGLPSDRFQKCSYTVPICVLICVYYMWAIFFCSFRFSESTDIH
jgi:hypothetical protein